MSHFLQLFDLTPHTYHLPAIQHGSQTITYHDLATSIGAKAIFYQKRGVKQGDRVAFQAKTTIETILAFFALLSLEASPCPINFRYPDSMLQTLLQQGFFSFLLHVDTDILEKTSYTSPNTPATLLLFTSGSSGSPKLLHLDINKQIQGAKQAAIALRLDQPSRWLLSVPLFHVSGLSIIFRCFATANTVLLDGIPTHISFVPTQLRRFLQEPTVSSSSLRCILLGGAPIPESLLQQSSHLPIYTTYGLSEMGSQVTMSSAPISSLHLGKPLFGRELWIDPQGEIFVRGISLFSGYDSPHGPILSLTQDGWFATGDLGSLSIEGNLIYQGRKDNLFISGGENIYPEEIEKALYTISHIQYCAVVPLPDAEFGHRPVAFLQMDIPIPSYQQLYDILSALLPRFAIPIAFDPIPLHLQSQWKISKKSLIEYAKSKFENKKKI